MNELHRDPTVARALDRLPVPEHRADFWDEVEARLDQEDGLVDGVVTRRRRFPWASQRTLLVAVAAAMVLVLSTTLLTADRDDSKKVDVGNAGQTTDPPTTNAATPGSAATLGPPSVAAPGKSTPAKSTPARSTPASEHVAAPGRLFWTNTAGDLFVARADGSGSHSVTLPAHEGTLSGLASYRHTRVAFVLTRSQAKQLWTAAADGTDVRQVAGAVDPSSPTWSPDGTRIAYQSGVASLRVIGADGSNDRLVTTVGGPMDSPEWAPSGTEVVYAHNDAAHSAFTRGATIEIVDVDANPAQPRILATTGTDRTFGVHWSPDGTHLSYLLPAGLYVIDSAGQKTVRVAEGGDPSFAGGAPWSPDGRFLLVCRPQGGGFMGGLSGSSLTRVEVSSQASAQVGETACLTPAWSPDGRFTATVDLSQAVTTHLVIRTADGRFVSDLGEAWGVGVAWTH